MVSNARTFCRIIDDRRGRGQTHRNMFAVVLEQHIRGCRAASTKRKISFRPKMAMNWQFFAEGMHERFVGSFTTAGVGDGPTGTCLQLYWSNRSGVAGPPARKKISFRPKWPKIAHFLPKDCTNVLYDDRRPPGSGTDPLRLVCSCIGATYRGLQGRQHRKQNPFLPKNGHELPIFCRKNAPTFCRIIDNRRGRGLTH